MFNEEHEKAYEAWTWDLLATSPRLAARWRTVARLNNLGYHNPDRANASVLAALDAARLEELYAQG